MSPQAKGSAAGVTTPPESAVVRSLHRCADRLEYVGRLAGAAAEHGRTYQGARYLVDELDDLAADVARLRAFLARPGVAPR